MKLIKPAAVDTFGSGLDKKIDMLYSGLRPLLRTFIEYQKLFKGTLKALLRPGCGLRRMRRSGLACLRLPRRWAFTCGADWTSFPDNPHIQWNGNGKYKSSDILAGRYPPTMPKYVGKEEEDVPERFRPMIDKLMSAGIIQGDGSDPTGNGDIINLTHEQVRTLVFIYRGGGFDRKLEVVGLETAV